MKTNTPRFSLSPMNPSDKDELTRFFDFLATKVESGELSVDDHKSLIDAGTVPLAHAGFSAEDQFNDPSLKTVFAQCLNVMKRRLEQSHPSLYRELTGRNPGRQR